MEENLRAKMNLFVLELRLRLFEYLRFLPKKNCSVYENKYIFIELYIIYSNNIFYHSSEVRDQRIIQIDVIFSVNALVIRFEKYTIILLQIH